MILSSGGCKVSWALRGGTGNAALASASGRLAGGIQTANPPTDNGDFQKDFSITAVRRLRENQTSLSGLSTLNSADSSWGRGMRGDA